MNNQHIKAVIIEDEPLASRMLKDLITSISDNIEIMGIFESVNPNIQTIISLQPDIVFLDIVLKGGKGFDLFDHFEHSELPFEVIFTTAAKKYAIRAMELSAVGYLLKPINLELLRKAIQKATEQLSLKEKGKRYQILKENLQNDHKTLTIPIANSYVFCNLDEILYGKSFGNYTQFHLKSGENHMSNQSLKYYTDLLQGFHFFRVSKSFILNLKNISEVSKGSKWEAIMVDNEKIVISPLVKNEFFKKFIGK